MSAAKPGNSQSFPLSDSVTKRLNEVRVVLRKYVLWQTAFTVVFWILFVFWIGGMLDFLPVRVGSSETPRWLRIGFLAAMGVGCLWTLFVWAIPRLVRRINNRSIALLIERHYPSLQNRLITAVDLSEKGTPSDVSNPGAFAAMLQRVHAPLDEQMSSVNIKHLFNWQPMWAKGLAAILAVSVTLVAAVGKPEFVGLWAKRLFALSSETWPRRAALRADGVQIQYPAFAKQLSAERAMLPFENGVVRLAAGTPSVLLISADAQDKEVPEVCTVYYASESGERGRANLRRLGGESSGWQQFALDGPPLNGLSSDVTLDVVGLDARIDDLAIQAIEPVVVTEMQVKCVYPPYLLRSVTRPPEEVVPYRTGMTIPEGTQISLLGKASRPLSEIQYLSSLRAVPGDGEDEPTIAEQIVTVATSGNSFEISLGHLDSTGIFELRIIDEFGLPSERVPKYVITMLKDTIPDVATKLSGIGSAITPKAILPLRGTVEDDNGIASVYVELVKSDQEPVRLPLQLTDGSVLEQSIDLQQLAEQGRFNAQTKELLGLSVVATDFFDLTGEEHQGRGQPVQLSVVTEDELLVILDRQELGLRQRLEQILVELSQLRSTLQDLATEVEESAWIQPGNRSGRENLGQENLNALVQSERRRSSFVSVLQDGDVDNASEAVEKQRRRRIFRAQQSVQQADKSKQELAGVSSRMDEIRRELQNNRIDSYDRQIRLEEKVVLPLNSLLEGIYQELTRQLLVTQTEARIGPVVAPANRSIATLDEVIISLEAIRDSMLDIESFNEIIDLVRGLLEEQDALIEQTENAQNAKFLDFLK